MDRYKIKKPAKTRFLNLFRKLFTLSLPEVILSNLTNKNSLNFLHKLIPPDYLYPAGSFRDVVRNGIRYQLDISHVIDHGVYFGYRDRSYDSIREEFGGYSVIIDVGANIGTSALNYSHFNSSAKIFSFEPHTTTYERAKHNLSLNESGNIELIQEGLGEKESELKLYEVNPNNPGMNRILNGDRTFPYSTIKISTLDKFMKHKGLEALDFIKIDVEGFEHAVLKGGIESIQKYKPVLFIELDDENLRENNSSAKEVLALLQSLGYSHIYRATDMYKLDSDDIYHHCHYDIIAKQS